MLNRPPAQVLVWGTYDISKPRVRLLLEGLRAVDVPFSEVHVDVWSGVRDKGTLTWREQLGAALRWLAAMPRLVVGFCRAPRHDAVLIPYLGLFDLLVLAPFARWRRTPVIWDLFISPYDTVVHDRRLLGTRHPLALVLYGCEWIACRLATRLFLDTAPHARRYEVLMHLPAGRVGAVPLGTDPTRFSPRIGAPSVHSPLRVFFYGQYIPLHGLETVVRAAARCEARGVSVTWTLAGTGQEQARVSALITELGVRSVTQLGWLAPADVPAAIRESDVGLGIFGGSDKALTVVPNKVYEIAATQTPIISADTPAMREFARGHPWVRLVGAGNADELADAVEHILAVGEWPPAPSLPVVGPREVGRALVVVADGLITSARRESQSP